MKGKRFTQSEEKQEYNKLLISAYYMTGSALSGLYRLAHLILMTFEVVLLLSLFYSYLTLYLTYFMASSI